MNIAESRSYLFGHIGLDIFINFPALHISGESWKELRINVVHLS